MLPHPPNCKHIDSFALRSNGKSEEDVDYRKKSRVWGQQQQQNNPWQRRLKRRKQAHPLAPGSGEDSGEDSKGWSDAAITLPRKGRTNSGNNTNGHLAHGSGHESKHHHGTYPTAGRGVHGLLADTDQPQTPITGAAATTTRRWLMSQQEISPLDYAYPLSEDPNESNDCKLQTIMKVI